MDSSEHWWNVMHHGIAMEVFCLSPWNFFIGHSAMFSSFWVCNWHWYQESNRCFFCLLHVPVQEGRRKQLLDGLRVHRLWLTIWGCWRVKMCGTYWKLNLQCNTCWLSEKQSFYLLYFIDMSDICRKFSYFTCLKSFTICHISTHVKPCHSGACKPTRAA